MPDQSLSRVESRLPFAATSGQAFVRIPLADSTIARHLEALARYCHESALNIAATRRVASASRVTQARFLATLDEALLASKTPQPNPTLADHGIELKFRRLPGGNRVVALCEDPGDALFPQNRENASPKPGPPPQPTQNEELIANENPTLLSAPRCVTDKASKASASKPRPLAPGPRSAPGPLWSRRSGLLDFAEAALEKAALGVVGDEVEGPGVAFGGLPALSGAAEKVGTSGV